MVTLRKTILLVNKILVNLHNEKASRLSVHSPEFPYAKQSLKSTSFLCSTQFLFLIFFCLCLPISILFPRILLKDITNLSQKQTSCMKHSIELYELCSASQVPLNIRHHLISLLI